MDDNAQMMVLEAVIFSMLVVISLIFIYQLSPPSTVSNVYTEDLKIQGDLALQSLLDNDPVGGLPDNYPLSLLAHFLTINDYKSLVNNLKGLLGEDVMFNLFIARAEKIEDSSDTHKKFWCSSNYDDGDEPDPSANALETTGSVTISSCLVAIEPIFLGDNIVGPFNPLQTQILEGRFYKVEPYSSDLLDQFSGYTGTTYYILLEMWET